MGVLDKKNGKQSFAVPVVSIVMMIVFPVSVLLSVFHFLCTSTDFYLEALKGSYLLRAFVEGKNDETNRRIREEIDQKVRLDEYAIIAQRSKEKFEREKDRFEKINKTKEYLLYEKQLKDIRRGSFEDYMNSFATEKAYEEYREREIQRLRKSISDIETYRSNNEREIEIAEERFEKARREMERAMEELQEKNEEAQEIIEKYRDTFAARINDDMKLLMPILEKLFNEKIIDIAIRKEIEKMIGDYPKQRMLGNVYESPQAEEGARVRLPQVTLSLWVDDGTGGKRHLLSDIFVEEAAKVDGLKNRFLFTSLFRMSDSVIAEFMANKVLKNSGMSIRDGIINMPPLVLEGATARNMRLVMLFATYGGYIKHFIGALFVLFIAYMFFARMERKQKFLWLKRIMLYPSIVMLIVSLGFIIASRSMFEYMPYIFPDAMLVGFAKNVAYSFAWCVAVPLGGVFLVVAIAGYLIGFGARKSQ
jgi:hypothetical protein